MRNISVKIRITAWLTILMAVLAGLLLAFMMAISSIVANQTAMDQLKETVRSNVQLVNYENGSLQFDDGFSFYSGGVSILVYNQNGALMAGQVPVSFTSDETFVNGTVRTVESDDDDYYVLDFWLPSDWENGVWVRGLMEEPENSQISRNLLIVALVALPVFMILVILGSYGIAKRAFRPLDNITATASSINEARDLSRRINLPPGRDEFSQLASTFDQLFERLERSFEAEKQFTADASHELRTPVSIIKGASEYGLKYDETPEERHETLTMIHRQSVKMAELISQLLSMTRLDQGTEGAHLEKTDMGELIKSMCGEQAWDKERLILNIKDGIISEVDPILMSRLIQNLVENAFKYGKPDGHVWVSLDRKNNETVLSVKDDGIGIAPEQQDKVWQRFYQVDPSRSGEGGAGLGLSMVKQIARLHGGYMTLESENGKGSTFTLHLPEK